MSVQVHVGGMAGLGVGLLAVAVAAGYTGQFLLGDLCALVGFSTETLNGSVASSGLGLETNLFGYRRSP